MALNPPISLEGLPLKVEGEYLILQRENIEVEFKIPNVGKKTGKGKVLTITQLYITTARMVYVDKDFKNKPFKSFDIPLLNIIHEKFEQPIFGSNYLQGGIKPLFNLLPGVTEFKLWFMSGGCAKFLQHFGHVLTSIRKTKGNDRAFQEKVRIGAYGQNDAFVDPSDPTVMFVEQPNADWNKVILQKKAQQNNQFYGDANMFQEAMKFQQMMQGQGQQIGSNQQSFPNQNNPAFQNQQQPNNYPQQFGPPQGFQQQQGPNQQLQPQVYQQNYQYDQNAENKQGFQNQQNQFPQNQQQANQPGFGQGFQNQPGQFQGHNQFQQEQLSFQQQFQQTQNQQNPNALNNNFNDQPQQPQGVQIGSNQQGKFVIIGSQQFNVQQGIPQNQQNTQQNQQQPPQMNVGYYYGWYGTPLQRNN